MEKRYEGTKDSGLEKEALYLPEIINDVAVGLYQRRLGKNGDYESAERLSKILREDVERGRMEYGGALLETFKIYPDTRNLGHESELKTKVYPILEDLKKIDELEKDRLKFLMSFFVVLSKRIDPRYFGKESVLSQA